MRVRDTEAKGHIPVGQRATRRGSRPNHPVAHDATAQVRLTRKLAEVIDGIDLSSKRVGDLLELTPREAETLVAEGWAERVPRTR